MDTNEPVGNTTSHVVDNTSSNTVKDAVQTSAQQWLNTSASALSDSISQGILSHLPASLNSTWKTATAEINMVVNTVLQDRLLKMDVLTRDEFDAQKNVLERLVKTVEKLEAEIAELTTNATHTP